MRGPLGPGLDTGPGGAFARQGGGLGAPAAAASSTMAAAPVQGTSTGGLGLGAGGGALDASPRDAGRLAGHGVASTGLSGFAADDRAPDEPSLDDEDAPADPSGTLTGEAAAVELLRVGLGATVIEQRGGD
jgi:DNA polymerase-3 subunit gamma/tau